MEKRRPHSEADLRIVEVIVLGILDRAGFHSGKNIVPDHEACNQVSGFVGIATEFGPIGAVAVLEEGGEAGEEQRRQNEPGDAASSKRSGIGLRGGVAGEVRKGAGPFRPQVMIGFDGGTSNPILPAQANRTEPLNDRSHRVYALLIPANGALQ